MQSEPSISRETDLIHEKLIAASSAGRHHRQQELRHPLRRDLSPSPRQAATRRSRPDIQLVVVGSSTGGPNALQTLFKRLPARFPVPIVVAQHMPPQFTSALARRLDETCPPRVVDARDGDEIERGTIYLAPSGLHMRVTQRLLKVEPDRGEGLYKPSVDILAQSARLSFGKHVLRMMLTGMGNDGTRKFLHLRRAGGYTVAQNRASSIVYGMPRSLVEVGGADEIADIDSISERMISILNG